MQLEFMHVFLTQGLVLPNKHVLRKNSKLKKENKKKLTNKVQRDKNLETFLDMSHLHGLTWFS